MAAAIPPLATTAGIDVSHHQGTVNWHAVAESGVDFAFAKATEGLSFVDPQFASNWAGMKNAGILRGAYHFFRPMKSVAAQIENFLRTVGEIAPGDLSPVLDLEEAPVPNGDEWESIPPDERVPLALQWLQAVENQLGRKPIVYVRRGFIAQELPHADPLGQFPLWIAHYTSRPAPILPTVWSNWTFWQHTDGGKVNGIGGHVDLDRFNGALEDLQALAHLGDQ